MGRGDGELGEKLAEENKEQGDLILGHHRFIHLMLLLMMVIYKQRVVPQPAIQVRPSPPMVTGELQVRVNFATQFWSFYKYLEGEQAG